MQTRSPSPSLHPPSRGREEEGEGKRAYLSNPSLECDNRRQCANMPCGAAACVRTLCEEEEE